ncbi:MAG: mechanosensitive ion channel family protein [Acidimicrobiales bacterium]
MGRPLWKDLRAAREQRSLSPLSTWTTVPLPPRPRFGLAILATVVAIAALVLDQEEGSSLLHSASVSKHAWAGSMSAVFLIFGAIAARRFATQVGRLVHVGGGPTAGAALRLILTITGLILVFIVTIGMLGVSPARLLTAAGITGVILGLAAQQSLGNVFAGIVLMVARPFSVGQRIRVRSGSFGGIFDGEVQAMGLTYVELLTDDGLLRIPNLGMLAAAVGPAPQAAKVPDPKSLYVNRALAKRPPRTLGPHTARRPHREPTVRRPREIIRLMRRRRGSSPKDPPDKA